ncbi:MAG: phosphoadenosine phosphosulfate reductase family protein [Desulfurococcaceae archaeon]
MYALKWFVKQNVPVIVRGFSDAWRIKGDAWIAGLYERSVLSEAIEREFNIRLNFDRKYIVFHRVPSWAEKIDYVVEVFGEGARLGLLYYDLEDKWKIIPSGALASILIEHGAEGAELTEPPKGYFKNKRIKLNEFDCGEKEYVLFKTRNYAGVGRVIDSVNCVIKVKDLAPLGFKLLNEPTERDLINHNEQFVEEAAEEAKSFIRSIYREKVSPGKMHVSFSGGADSATVLSLAVEELGSSRVVAVYTDTGLEYPETQRYVERTSSKLGVELVVLKPSVSIIEEIRRRGLMNVENRWCTAILKLEPIKKYYKANGVKVYLDGARDYESTLRARTPRLSENPSIPGVIRALPIKKWPRILVQIYLKSRSLELNPLYDKGLSRIGCIICPAMHIYELDLSYQMYKSVHEEVLKITGIKREDYLLMKWSGKRS